MSKLVDSSVVSDGWKNWQIALAVGIPTAFIGLFVYKRYKNRTAIAMANAVAPGEEVQIDEMAQTYKKRGNKHFMAGRYESAVECYTKAIELSAGVGAEELSTFHQNRAAACEHLKNYVQVISDCSQALELNPKYIKAMNRRAKAFKQTGFLTESLEDVTAACILENFGNQDNLLLADSIIKELSQRRAVDRIKARRPFDPSPIHVWNVVSSFANDPVFKPKNIYNANVNNRNEDKQTSRPYQKALEEFYEENFNNILKLCTEEINTEGSVYRHEAHSMRGTFYFLRGEYDNAMNDFQYLLDNEEVDDRFKVNALIKRAKIRMHMNNTQEAIDDFNLAVNIDISNSDIYMHRGQLHLIMENLETAISDFEKSISLTDDLSTPHIHKCYTEVRKLLGESDVEAAKIVAESFDDILKKFPDCADGYAFYGQALLDLKDFDRADECFKKAIALDSKNPNSYVHRGILKISWKEDLDGAVQLIRKAIQIDGRSCFALQALGTIELQRGAIEPAIHLLKKAIEFSTSEAEMTHLFSILIAAEVQSKMAQKFQVPLSPYV